MKILLLLTELYNPAFKGGIQVFNNFLVKALLELGHTLSIISINDTLASYPLNFSSSQLLNLSSSQLLNFSPSFRYPFLRKPLFILDTLKQLLKFKPDLILCGHVNFSPMAVAISKIFKIPYFTLTYGVDVWNLNEFKIIGIKHSHRIITISKYTKRIILEQVSVYQEDKVQLLYPTFDHEKFKPAPKPEYLMERWKINEKDKILLTVARLSKTEKYKGYDKVILALSQLLNFSSSHLPNFSSSLKYLLVGAGDDLQRVKSLIKELHLEDYVILTGYVPDEELVDYYNLCDVFLMPSKKEGFGIVFLEALACGKTVIAGSKDGSVDAVLDGELGILVDPDSLAQIKDAIGRVFKKDVPEKLLDGDYLRKRVIEVYGFDKFKERLRCILNETI